MSFYKRHYINNLIGDVIFIYRSDNLKVAEYSYNAFGQTSINYNIDSIASINPFRYKSYYYDNETGLYYLISRYYSPVLMRFLTPDSIKYVNPDAINGVNLYVYCGNNPVMGVDPKGNIAISLTILGLIIGAAIGSTAGGITAYNVAKHNGKTGWELFGWTMLGIIGGGVVGGAIGSGVGALITKATGIIGLSITKYSIIPIKGTTVLGSMNVYISAATATGSGFYSISEKLWDKLSVVERWSNNSQYIYDAYSLGSKFILYSDKIPKQGSTLLEEIRYLVEHCIPWEMF